jgi:hypothetical protein
LDSHSVASQPDAPILPFKVYFSSSFLLPEIDHFLIASSPRGLRLVLTKLDIRQARLGRFSLACQVAETIANRF